MRRLATHAFTISICSAALFAGACDEAHIDEQAPSFVLITIDTLRADHLGSYGYHRNTSPTLDALASDALLFENVLAPMPMTLPSHVSLLTASLPARHGVLSNFRYLEIPFAAREGLQSVSQILGSAGYATAAFTSASPLSANTGIGVGFAQFSGPPSVAQAGSSVRRLAGETVDLALEWLEAADRPFFLWVHLFDPHRPYQAPEGWLGTLSTDDTVRALLVERGFAEDELEPVADLVNRYDEEILYTDAQLARLLDGLRRLDLFESSVIALTSDHGEALMQRGDFGHASLFRNTIGIPLILRWPDGPRGERVSKIGSLIDVLPTLRAHTRLPLGDRPFDGEDLLSAGTGSALAQKPIDSNRPREDTFALTTDGWKYWRHSNGRRELYDVASDRYERDDVSDRHPQVVSELDAELLAILQHARSQPGVVVTEDIDPELRARLRELGYAE